MQAQMSLATPTGGLQKNISFKMNRPWGQSASLEALELQQQLNGVRGNNVNYLALSQDNQEKNPLSFSHLSIIVDGVE